MVSLWPPYQAPSLFIKTNCTNFILLELVARLALIGRDPFPIFSHSRSSMDQLTWNVLGKLFPVMLHQLSIHISFLTSIGHIYLNCQGSVHLQVGSQTVSSCKNEHLTGCNPSFSKLEFPICDVHLYDAGWFVNKRTTGFLLNEYHKAPFMFGCKRIGCWMMLVWFRTDPSSVVQFPVFCGWQVLFIWSPQLVDESAFLAVPTIVIAAFECSHGLISWGPAFKFRYL